jgi:hypothetical protein
MLLIAVIFTVFLIKKIVIVKIVATFTLEVAFRVLLKIKFSQINVNGVNCANACLFGWSFWGYFCEVDSCVLAWHFDSVLNLDDFGVGTRGESAEVLSDRGNCPLIALEFLQVKIPARVKSKQIQKQGVKSLVADSPRIQTQIPDVKHLQRNGVEFAAVWDVFQKKRIHQNLELWLYLNSFAVYLRSFKQQGHKRIVVKLFIKAHVLEEDAQVFHFGFAVREKSFVFQQVLEKIDASRGFAPKAQFHAKYWIREHGPELIFLRNPVAPICLQKNNLFSDYLQHFFFKRDEFEHQHFLQLVAVLFKYFFLCGEIKFVEKVNFFEEVVEHLEVTKIA